MPWDGTWFAKARTRRRFYEIYAVFIIIVVTMGLVIHVYKSQAHVANRATCTANLRRLMMSFEMYASDHDGQYPSKDRWVHELLPYEDSNRYFFCPGATNVRTPRRDRKRRARSSIESFVSYWYIRPEIPNGGDPTSVPVIGDRMYFSMIGNHDDGGNVGYLDAHVRWRNLDRWAKDSLPTQQITTE